jgi:hypothetical protein
MAAGRGMVQLEAVTPSCSQKENRNKEAEKNKTENKKEETKTRKTGLMGRPILLQAARRSSAAKNGI